jgi:hypothetical protein
MYRSQFGKLGLQAGLRSELTLTDSYEFNTDNTVVNNYFNLFPSLYLSYELGPEESLMLNYSRRISRPRASNLAPFTMPRISSTFAWAILFFSLNSPIAMNWATPKASISSSLPARSTTAAPPTADPDFRAARQQLALCRPGKTPTAATPLAWSSSTSSSSPAGPT